MSGGSGVGVGVRDEWVVVVVVVIEKLTRMVGRQFLSVKSISKFSGGPSYRY